MAEKRVVVIGASAGGVEALSFLARTLPPDLPAPVCVVLHVPEESPSLLAQILNRQGGLGAKEADDREQMKNGLIYVAPPGRHLTILADGRLRIVRGPRENRHRPSIDPLMRSAAAAFNEGVIGVILTGWLDDGTAGLHAVKTRGGIAIVQDPSEAEAPGMPQSAIDHVAVDHVIPLRDIPTLLVRLVIGPIRERASEPASDTIELEARLAELEANALERDDRPGNPSAFSCPDCGGVLWEIDEERLVRFRCRVGHAFSPETMVTAQDEVLEQALWSAVKTLEESARLSRRIAESEEARGHDWMVKRFRDKERHARKRVEVIRRFLVRDSAAIQPGSEEHDVAAG